MHNRTNISLLFIVIFLVFVVSGVVLQFYPSIQGIDQERLPAGYAYTDSLATIGMRSGDMFSWNFSQNYPYSRNKTFTLINNAINGTILPGLDIGFGVTRDIDTECDFSFWRSDTYEEITGLNTSLSLNFSEAVAYSILVNRISINMTIIKSNNSRTFYNFYTANGVHYVTSVLDRKLQYFHHTLLLAINYTLGEHPTIWFYYTLPNITFIPKLIPFDVENITIIIQSYWNVVFSQGRTYAKSVTGSLDNMRIELHKINSTAIEINHTLNSFISQKIPIYYTEGGYSLILMLMSVFGISGILIFAMAVVIIFKKAPPKSDSIKQSYKNPK